ncbi:MAG: PH domain-containing protein [Actinomycetota bacterium]
MPGRQQRYPPGVAQYGVLLAAGLVLVVLSFGAVWMTVARNGRLAILVGAVGAVFGAVGGSAMAGASLFYQARPSPRSPVGAALVWRPPLAVRGGAVLALVGITMAAVSLAILAGTPMALVAIFPWFVARVLVARLEADRWGIRCTNLFATVRIPWSDVRSLEARGGSIFTQRIVAVTEQGRERTLFGWDPRVPITRDVAVAELEAVRQLATKPHADGID